MITIVPLLIRCSKISENNGISVHGINIKFINDFDLLTTKNKGLRQVLHDSRKARLINGAYQGAYQ